ncbi:amiloride-sensitive sodium channel subunit beta-like [Pecten maximus]|uniref:amiloride-sensitive sodium channel subunit beta-like n=1 Tax=Pecten maximus TaxID=6579 RepID=UPI0014587F50|nr:amiloride-sensitive sodium channel subunit beta-like [Pecten maximus]
MRVKKNVTDMFTKLQPADTMRIHNIKVSPRPSRKRSLSDTLRSIKTINEAVTNVKKKEPGDNEENIRTVIRSIGETSSVHGVSRVFSGSTRRRTIWLLLILTFSGYFVYQLHGILTHYYSYPIKTSLNMETRPLLLPSITICNTNTVRMSQIRESGTKIMKKLMEIERPGLFKNGTSGLEYGRETFQDLLSSMSNISDTVYDTASFQISDSDVGHADDDHLGVMGGNEAPEELDDFYILNEKLKQEYESLTREERINMGHEIDKMLLHCTFAGRACKWPKRRHVSNEYGNCYTFESPSYVATRSGPEFGFQMTLNLETHEAIPHLTRGYGARLVTHQYGSLPFPAEEGVTLSSAYETSIGLRMTKISRLGQPHGSCAIPTDYFGKRKDGNTSFSIRYSNQACMVNCKEDAIERVCNCFESSIKNEINTGYFRRSEQLQHCAQSVEDFGCATAVTKDFLTGTRRCFCPNACNETVYSRSFSGRLWPSHEYLEDLMKLACSKYDLPHKSCPLRNLNPDQMRMNFLKINIYYEDLNFEFLSEEPEYELMNLLSDIGGSLGLFLGASVLSLGEIIEILVELIYFILKKSRNQLTGESKD